MGASREQWTGDAAKGAGCHGGPSSASAERPLGSSLTPVGANQGPGPAVQRGPEQFYIGGEDDKAAGGAGIGAGHEGLAQKITKLELHVTKHPNDRAATARLQQLRNSSQKERAAKPARWPCCTASAAG